MRIEREGIVTAIIVMDRVAVRGRIGESSQRILGWTKGRTIASVSVDGMKGDLEISLSAVDAETIARRLPDRARVLVTIELIDEA